LRSVVDTIIVGVGTVIADDPRLTVRLDEFAATDAPTAQEHPDAVANELLPPLRVVVDSHDRTPANARVRDASAPTRIATSDQVGAGQDGQVDLAKLLTQLYEDGRRYALLEGGPTLAGAFWRAGLIDRVVAYVAPSLLGSGAAALGDAGVPTIDEAIRLDVTDVDRVGTDIRITARPLCSAPAAEPQGAKSDLSP
jgi:diaminohydroxyphosphoribosylaminopyrimidine deaminase/5-amino-6-(5-phosphoribosylamino)uracil reductase